MEKVTILGKSLQGDFTNPTFARTFEDEILQVGETVKTATEAERGSDGIRIMCGAIIDAFDHIFGKGTSQKVLGKETNLMTCLDAFAELAGVYDSQITPMVNERSQKVMALIHKDE